MSIRWTSSQKSPETSPLPEGISFYHSTDTVTLFAESEKCLAPNRFYFV